MKLYLCPARSRMWDFRTSPTNQLQSIFLEFAIWVKRIDGRGFILNYFVTGISLLHLSWRHEIDRRCENMTLSQWVLGFWNCFWKWVIKNISFSKWQKTHFLSFRYQNFQNELNVYQEHEKNVLWRTTENMLWQKNKLEMFKRKIRQKALGKK